MKQNELWWNPNCVCGKGVVSLDAAAVTDVIPSDAVRISFALRALGAVAVGDAGDFAVIFLFCSSH